MIAKDSPILLVDDSAAACLTIQGILEEVGYTHIDTAVDGRKGLDRMLESLSTSNPYKLVFLDWNMPVMNGLDFLKLCRADKELRETPIIMLTAVSDQKDMLRALGNGATSFIVKPTNKEVIVSTIDRVATWIETRGACP